MYQFQSAAPNSASKALSDTVAVVYAATSLPQRTITTSSGSPVVVPSTFISSFVETVGLTTLTSIDSVFSVILLIAFTFSVESSTLFEVSSHHAVTL